MDSKIIHLEVGESYSVDCIKRVKYCPGCKMDLPIAEFWADIYKNDGMRSYCKKCESKRRLKWFESIGITPNSYAKIKREIYKNHNKIYNTAEKRKNELKHCYACDKVKQRKDFNKNACKSDGRQSKCRECEKGRKA